MVSPIFSSLISGPGKCSSGQPGCGVGRRSTGKEKGHADLKPGRTRVAEQKEKDAFHLLWAPSIRAPPIMSPHKPTANRQPVPQARQWQAPEHLPLISMVGRPGFQIGLAANGARAGGLAWKRSSISISGSSILSYWDNQASWLSTSSSMGALREELELEGRGSGKAGFNEEKDVCKWAWPTPFEHE